ncbi:MAG: mechanosensitive ion channel family protein [Rhodothalassiaceae bacterium]
MTESVEGLLGLVESVAQQIASMPLERLILNTVLSVLVLLVMIFFRMLVGRLATPAPQEQREDEEETSEPRPQEQHMKRLGRLMKRGATVMATLVGAMIIASIWGLTSAAWASVRGAILGSAMNLVVILIISFFAWQAVPPLLDLMLVPSERNGQRAARASSLSTLLGRIARFVIGSLAFVLILAEIGLEIGPLLAGAGIIGVAIGFGAQSLVKDFLTGIMILVEDIVAVGDVAELGGHTGLVEAMGMRTVQLRDLDGIVHTVPYSEVTSVKNYTKTFSYALFRIGVAYGEDIERVIDVIKDEAAAFRREPDFRRLIIEDLEMFGLDDFADSQITIMFRFKTRPLQQWGVKRAFNLRLKRRFDAEGIEIPFPHRTLYIGEQGQQGAALRTLFEQSQATRAKAAE